MSFLARALVPVAAVLLAASFGSYKRELANRATLYTEPNFSPVDTIAFPRRIFEGYDRDSRTLRVTSDRDGRTHTIRVPANFHLVEHADKVRHVSQFFWVVNGQLLGPTSMPLDIPREKLLESFTVKYRFVGRSPGEFSTVGFMFIRTAT
ncbi:MAG: hypothetical protein WEE89_18810 [Gemmatimonadota bacterium]